MTQGTYTIPARWEDALTAFVTAQRAASYAPNTIDQRVKHVRRFALETGLNPWHVTYEDLRAWLDSIVSSRHTMLAHRASLRAFYRWARASGRIFADPSEEPSYIAKQLPIPPIWETELAAFKRYLRSIGQPETTVGVRSAQLRRFARDNASLEPWSATLDHLSEWLSAKHWSPETRRGHRSALRTFYQWGKDTHRIKKNPARKLPKVRAGFHAPRPALETEYALALAKSNRRERMALMLAADIGLRCGEVVKVHSKDLMNVSGAWSLLVRGKGRKDRSIPLTDNMAGALRTFPPGFVFPGAIDGHMSAGYMGKLVSRLLPEGVTMHMLRHRFATQAYAVDRDVFTVQQILGHASPETTKRYVKITEDTMRRLVHAVAL